MAKHVVEFIGTFYLFLVVAMTVIGGVGNFAPIAIGLTLMVMVYAGGHISGAHYNPAVTTAVFCRGKCSFSDLVPYILIQLVAGFVAAIVATQLLPHLAVAMPIPAAKPVIGILLAEFLGTFALCYVVLNTATVSATSGNYYFGLAIGSTVLVCAYALGGISGGAFNPAVAVGAAHSGLILWSQIWIYFVAQIAAGIAAAMVFKFINQAEH